MARPRHYVAALAAALLAGRPGAEWVQTTVADQEAADKMQSLLLLEFDAKQLEIHTVEVQSYYWQDDVVIEQKEVKFTVDSSLSVDRLRAAVEKVHPYSMPMIVSHSTGNVLKEKGKLGQYLVGEYVTKVGAEHAGPMAKVLVDARYAATVSVDTKEEETGGHRVSFKTTGASKPHMLREFAHKFEWTPIHGNRASLDYVDANVKVRGGDEL